MWENDDIAQWKYGIARVQRLLHAQFLILAKRLLSLL
jgi:hypothetical protein